MAKSLPADIIVFTNEDGAFIEIESLIRFLRSDDNIPEEYLPEARHLKKMADFLEEQLAEILSQKNLLSEIFDTSKPN